MDTHSKAFLRKHYTQLRRGLEPNAVEALNQSLLKQVQALDWQKYRVVHVFLPILAQKEPDTFRIISWLRNEHPQIRVAVPKIADAGNGLLSHVLLDKDSMLETNQWGIPEPVEGGLVPPEGLDAVVVPLLVFDLSGHRVGYGKGFYDRFLRECRPDVLRMGLSFFDPVPAITDVLPTDVPLDCCITPAQVYRFGKPRD